MVSFERNGVTIEQCQQCRGVFLDRGELEQLIDATERAYAAPPTQMAPPPVSYGPGRGYPPGYNPGQGYPPGSNTGYGAPQGFLGSIFGYGGHHGHHGHHDDD